MSQPLQRLLGSTRRRARRGTERGAGGLSKRLGQRQPESRWIDCSGSRLPSNQVAGRICQVRNGMPVDLGLNIDARAVLPAAQSATLAAIRCRCGL